MAGKNEQVIEAGKKTQFKKGNTAAKNCIPRMTYRQQLQWLRDQDIDPKNIQKSLQKLMGIMPSKEITKQSVARIYVIEYVAAAIKRKDPTLFDKIINQTEGNLSQEVINRTGIPAPEDNETLEEASAAYMSTVAK